MKHLRGSTPIRQQFPHGGAAQSKKTEWVWPVLAVAAVALAVGLGTTLIPLPKASLDFRQDIPRPDGAAANGVADGFELIRWPDLVPQGWNPTQQIRSMQEAERTAHDSDPRAAARLKTLREVLDTAPANPALEGRAVRVPGYVVPLEGLRHGALEFLLVPYFGACIHTPPPPANQIIHVLVTKPVTRLRSMDAVWVRGTLSVVRRDSLAATSGYQLSAVAVDPYEPAQRQ